MIGWAIRQTVRQAQESKAVSAAGEARSKADSLQLELDRLSLVTEALWMLLQQKLGCTQEELVAAIEEIDGRDGCINGRPAKAEPQSCPGCGRTLMRHIPQCVYCGQKISLDPFQR
jgi:hypothetical protein